MKSQGSPQVSFFSLRVGGMTYSRRELLIKQSSRLFVLVSGALLLAGCSLNSPITKQGVGERVGMVQSSRDLQSGNLNSHQNPKIFVASVERLPDQLPEVELTLTPEVKREINRYLRIHRVGLQEAFDRRAEYMPAMEAIFRDEGLPVELLALPIIESGFNPNARSPVGARGLWQFMPGTARHYGLVVNKREDQRLDPILSTLAAARFLRDLYEEQGDWHLALAAYNAGSGGISRAMERTGSENYWQLCRAKRGITAQTQQFVPKFLAAAVIARRWNRYDAVELAADPALLLAGITPDA